METLSLTYDISTYALLTFGLGLRLITSVIVLWENKRLWVSFLKPKALRYCFSFIDRDRLKINKIVNTFSEMLVVNLII